jgi:hypothetical protein
VRAEKSSGVGIRRVAGDAVRLFQAVVPSLSLSLSSRERSSVCSSVYLYRGTAGSVFMCGEGWVALGFGRIRDGKGMSGDGDSRVFWTVPVSSPVPARSRQSKRLFCWIFLASHEIKIKKGIITVNQICILRIKSLGHGWSTRCRGNTGHGRMNAKRKEPIQSTN